MTKRIRAFVRKIIDKIKKGINKENKNKTT